MWVLLKLNHAGMVAGAFNMILKNNSPADSDPGMMIF